MTARADSPLILFSGMGADASVFSSQKAAFSQLVVPDWPQPLEGDDLSEYCRRLAVEIDPGQPSFIGGASFGGIVALEMTRHLDTLGCFLIGSVRNPQQLPRRIRILRSFGAAIGIVPISLLQRSAASSVAAARQLKADHLSNVICQFSGADAEVLRWSARQILKWKSSYDDVVVHHIHGDHDRVFPISLVNPDEIVAGGGHVISMTHGSQVNAFIRKHMQGY